MEVPILKLTPMMAISICRSHNEKVVQMSRALNRSGVKYRYQSYERLIYEPAQRSALLSFVSNLASGDTSNTLANMRWRESDRLLLHPSECENRIANFSELRGRLAHEPSCARTVAACDYLQLHAGRENHTIPL